MKKEWILFVLLVLLASCDKEVENSDHQPEIKASSAIELNYPDSIGTSGDTINGILGYGYDITGLCDSVSVKAKIYQTIPDVGFYRPNHASSEMVYGGSFNRLIDRFQRSSVGGAPGVILAHHVKSLLKLANGGDATADSTYAYAYFVASSIFTSRSFVPSFTTAQQLLTDAFKEDVVALTPEQIVSKYGTHVITKYYTGIKWEVLYRCKLDEPIERTVFECLFFNRMKEFMGSVPMMEKWTNDTKKYVRTDEELIYNSIGSLTKLCGKVNVTDFNPDSIRVDYKPVFTNYDRTDRLITIADALPIYLLIVDPVKKENVKAYIESCMIPSTVSSIKL